MRNRITLFFLALPVIFTLGVTWAVASTVIITGESLAVSFAWIGGFAFLFFNVAYLFFTAVFSIFVKKSVLSEAYFKSFPKTALIYPIRNETHGIFERIDYSLSGNKLPNLDLWILSDSDLEFGSFEAQLTERLRQKYGPRIHYRRRETPVERKQGNIGEFLTSHPEYAFIYVCDADGMVPKGVILKLIKKAEHPRNQDVAIFQCFVKIAHAATWYSRFEKIGTDFSQRFGFTTLQAIFGRSISFGHHHLARASLISRIDLPKGLLSHDNWDTVLLDRMGYRVAFCPDVCAFDEAPSNYLEARARARRWSQGTLQGWPLVFMPNISLASRFLVFYGIYLYLADLVFFFWAILALLAHSALMGELIHFKIDSIWLGLFTNSILKMVLIFTLVVTFFHKIVIVRTLKDLREYAYEVCFSTLVTLNNFFYVPLDILTLPLRKLVWRPMSKNPFQQISLGSALGNLWAGTIFGILGLYFCLEQTPYFVWQASPVLTSLIFSIPAVYLTAKSIPHGLKAWF